MRQLVEKAILGIKNGRSLIKINLKPEILGHLRIQISTENNQVAVRIITEVPMVKEMIESNLNQLRTDFQNQGLEIEKFDVHVDHGSTQNDRNPSRILNKNDEDRTGEEKVKNSLSEEAEVTVQNISKGRKSTLIDFFA
jgi:flagellar hook-length control protein FliK